MEWKDIDMSDNELRRQTDLYIKLALEAAAKSGSKDEISTAINSDKSRNDSNIIGNDINISDINIIVGNKAENVSDISIEQKNEKSEMQSGESTDNIDVKISDYSDQTEAKEKPESKQKIIEDEEESYLSASEKTEEQLHGLNDSGNIFSDISFLEEDTSNTEDFEKYIKQHNNQADSFQS